MTLNLTNDELEILRLGLLLYRDYLDTRFRSLETSFLYRDEIICLINDKKNRLLLCDDLYDKLSKGV